MMYTGSKEKNKTNIILTLRPYNSLSKNSFFIISSIVFLFFITFSILWLSIGAWPITIFMGVEYILLVYLLWLYLINRKIKEKIQIDDQNIIYEYYERKKLTKNLKFSSYWAKITFWKQDNNSRLVLKESNKKLEIGTFAHLSMKESVYKKISQYLSST